MKNFEKKTLKKQQSAKRAALTGALAAGLIMLPGMLGAAPALAQKAERDSLSYRDLITKTENREVERVELDEAEQVARVYLKGRKEGEQPIQVRLLEQTLS